MGWSALASSILSVELMLGGSDQMLGGPDQL
jgi:hypothetical protein